MQNPNKYFDALSKKAPTLQVRLDNAESKYAYAYSNTEEDQPFHSASVGKVFAATLIMMGVEEKRVALNTPVIDILDDTTLNNLFVYKTVDYKDRVTVEHLLGHTSGVNDYFEGKTLNKESLIDRIIRERDHLFTPEKLLDITRNNQKAVGKPGDRFLYSDTSYILIGLILEKLYNKPYADILREKLFDPFGLENTLLAFYDERFNQEIIAPILFKGVEMSQAKSLSCDHAGGGLITTTKDLAKFLHALFGEKIISRDSLEMMKTPRHRFHGIMRYGLGMIEIKINRVTPWKIGYPTLYGGLGILSVHAFYDEVNKDAYIINMGDPALLRRSFMALAKLMTYAHKNR